MNKLCVSVLCSIFILPLFSGRLLALGPFSALSAERNYEKGNYGEASRLYGEMISKDANRPGLKFNLGDSLYKEGKFDEAEENFLQTFGSSDPKLREKAFYNLGNTKYRQNSLKDAVDYYNEALNLNPQNEKARQNRDFVLKKMQEEKRDEQKPDENNENRDRQKENRDRGKREQQQQQDQGQQQEEQKSSGGNNGEDQPESAEGSLPEEKQKAPADNALHDKNNGRKISEKEASLWLESVRDDPKGAMRDMIRRDKGVDAKTIEKDW